MGSFTERFHEYTKYNPLTIDKVGEPRWQERTTPFRASRGGKMVSLRDRIAFLGMEKGTVDWSRWLPTSHDLPADADFVARLLYFSSGITGVMPTPEGNFHYRACPSAGGLYPIELHLALRGVAPFEDGLYAWHPLECALELIQTGDPLPVLQSLFPEPELLARSPVQLLLSGKTDRNTWRYHDRAWRRTLLDAGHLLANAQLYCNALGLENVPLAGFLDEELQAWMRCDADELPLAMLVLPVGEPHRHARPQPASSAPEVAVARLRPEERSFQTRQQNVERIREAFRFPAGPEALSPGHPASAATLARIPWREPIELMRQLVCRRSAQRFVLSPIPADSLGIALDAALASAPGERCAGTHLQMHLLTRDESGIPGGIYAIAPDGARVRLQLNLEWDEFNRACLNQPITQDAVAALVFSADLSAAVRSYGDRAYRYLHLDAGGVAQRLHLALGALGLGACGIGGYFDDQATRLLDLTPTQAVLYGYCIGTRKG